MGGLQAAQAGNELLGLTVKELMATRTLAAAHYRAQGLEAARDLMTREEARARHTRFMGDVQAYGGR
jgi:P-type conjugative transfer protein TrbJ